MTFGDLRAILDGCKRVAMCNRNGFPILKRETTMADIPPKYDGYRVLGINPIYDGSLQVFLDRSH